MAQYDLPSWMQTEAPSEPFKALLAGAQAGSQIAANRNQSKALNQRKYEFDVQSEQQAKMDAVRQKVMEQNLQLGGIHIANEIRTRDQLIDSERAYTEVANLWSRHKAMGIAGTDGSEAAIGYKVANNPNFFLNPGSKDLIGEMMLSRKTRDIAAQRDSDAAYYQQRVETQQAGLSERKRWDFESRKYVADVRSSTDIQEANIKAEADIKRAEIAASKWKDHARFRAFSDASSAMKLAVDPAAEPDRYARAINEIYYKFLPEGEPDEMGRRGNAPVTRAGPEVRPDVAPAPTFDWTPEGIKELK